MIFVSSSCVKNKKIKDSVLELANEGFKNIELSGGTDYYDGYLDDLLELQDQHSLQYLLHNYFPPPKEHFMLNLSSLDERLYQRSIAHCKQAISLCKKLGGKKYGVHAGFLIDFLPSEAGKKIGLKRVNDRVSAISRFNHAWRELTELAGDDIDLYIENNVFSATNFQTYQQNNPFLFTDYDSWMEFSKKVDCKLLLDFAHLKVSAVSLGLSFDNEVEKLIDLTDYYHISGNDGLHDQNQSIIFDQDLVNILEKYEWRNKTITLEIYDGMGSLNQSFDFLSSKVK